MSGRYGQMMAESHIKVPRKVCGNVSRPKTCMQ